MSADLPTLATDIRRIADELRGIVQSKDAVKAARLAVESLDGFASKIDPKGGHAAMNKG